MLYINTVINVLLLGQGEGLGGEVLVLGVRFEGLALIIIIFNGSRLVSQTVCKQLTVCCDW